MWRRLCVLVCLGAVRGSDHEGRLFAELLTGYNPLERPVPNSSQPLVVYFKFFLQQILDIDEPAQMASVNAWLSYSWQDYKLKWDPKEYGGIKDIRFPGTSDHIWKPDILLYNSAAENFDSTFKSNVLVYHTGDVVWMPPGVLKFSCKIDITWFPFDDQLCEMKFGSWTFHGNAIDLQLDKSFENQTHQMDLSTYVVNGEWTLVSSPAIRSETFYKCCPEPYPTVKFFLHIRRRTLYYEITILLSIVFFLSMVAEAVPPTSEAVPLIGVFFSCCMLVISASVVFTVVVLNLHFRGPDTHVMSPITRRILLEWLPWLMLMKRPGRAYSCAECRWKEEPSRKTLPRTNGIPLPGGDPGQEAQLLLLDALENELKGICKRLEKEDEDEKIQDDWRFAAMAVDRACLVLFSLFITLSSCSIMFSAPHLIA